MPALNGESKLWIACPKITSKITTDLNREGSWNKLTDAEFENVEQITLDHVWHATFFRKGMLVEEAGVLLEEKPAVKKKARLASV